MLGHDIIVVGTSAGGVEALTKLVRDLPSDLPAAIFIVLHFPTDGTSMLPTILSRVSALKAFHPEDGAAIEPGRIYIAPPNYHLLIKEGHVRLARGARENGHRPAIDPLFRTAAQTYGRRVIGVVLSGNLDDGTAGLLAVKQQGGLAVVQDPTNALFSGMPRSAIENVPVDYILPLSAIAPKLLDLVNQPIVQDIKPPISENHKVEARMAQLDEEALQKKERPGVPSGFACPECHGALWELTEGQVIRFRCRTGHAYSAETLLAEQSDAIETALWSALRALEERAALAQRLVQRARDRQQNLSALRFEAQEQDAQYSASIIRQLLLDGEGDLLDSLKQRKQASKREEDVSTASALESLKTFLVVVLAAAGDRQAVIEMIAALPLNFSAALLVIEYLDTQPTSQMVEMLNAQTPLPVKQAEDGDQLRLGTIHIAAANQPLFVNSDGIFFRGQTQTPVVPRTANLLLESLAANFKERVIAVILIGNGVDRSKEVERIKATGGTVIVQAQDDSEALATPQSALETGNVDFILPLPKIAASLVNLTQQHSAKNSEE